MAHYRTDTNNLRSESKVTHEVVMLSDLLTPSGNLTDAFGRLRVSAPVTLFDSQHRYKDNGKWATLLVGGGSYSHSLNESAINMTVDGTSGARTFRETRRVFAYQPGKSLLIFNTFAMATPVAGLRQRLGYFNSTNGVFLEQDGTSLYLVLRSNTAGIPADDRIAQSNWNIDKFDGTGYSSTVAGGSNWDNGLDVTKGNIFWISIEWLGVGNVKCGFVVDGKFVTAHDFRNENTKSTTYMTTACLPCRYEIENTDTTGLSSTLKQICTSVMSEGGYEIGGKARTIGTRVNSPRDLTANGTFYPVVSIRLNPSYLDSIVDLTEVSALGVSAGNYRFRIISGASITGATWTAVPGDSVVQYNSNNSATMTGGQILDSGFFSSTAQATGFLNKEPTLFRFQLERNGFTSTANTFTLAIEGTKNGDDVLGSLSWQEYI